MLRHHCALSRSQHPSSMFHPHSLVLSTTIHPFNSTAPQLTTNSTPSQLIWVAHTPNTTTPIIRNPSKTHCQGLSSGSSISSTNRLPLSPRLMRISSSKYVIVSSPAHTHTYTQARANTPHTTVQGHSPKHTLAGGQAEAYRCCDIQHHCLPA